MNHVNAPFMNINIEYSVDWGNRVFLLFLCTSSTELKFSKQSRAKEKIYCPFSSLYIIVNINAQYGLYIVDAIYAYNSIKVDTKNGDVKYLPKMS